MEGSVELGALQLELRVRDLELLGQAVGLTAQFVDRDGLWIFKVLWEGVASQEPGTQTQGAHGRAGLAHAGLGWLTQSGRGTAQSAEAGLSQVGWPGD